jgi:HlyD family secretion protein
MTANARIVTAEHDGVLRVPLQAIRFTPGGFADTAGAAPRLGVVGDARAAGSRGRAAASEGGARDGNTSAEGAARSTNTASEDAARSGSSESSGSTLSDAAPRHGSAARVWVLRGDKPAPVDVTTGLRDNTFVEISGGGLEEGDRVIINETGGARPADAESPARRMPLRF